LKLTARERQCARNETPSDFWGIFIEKTATKQTNPTELTDEVNQAAHYLHASAREHNVLVHSSEKGDGKAGKGEGVTKGSTQGL